jgi:hypothetical protein
VTREAVVQVERFLGGQGRDEARLDRSEAGEAGEHDDPSA